MPKKSHFRELCDKEHGKLAQALLSAASNLLYHIQTVKAIELEKVSLIEIANLGTAC